MRLACLLSALAGAAAQNCRATVWADEFWGTHASFGEGEYNFWKFANENYPMENDAVSSIEVTGRGCVALLYGGPNFDEWSATFPEGKYSLEASIQRGLHDNEVSSMRVGYGSRVAGSCKDSPGWVDQYGHSCKDYAKDGHCAGGHVLHDWVLDAEFHGPQINCCVCGGGRQGQCEDTQGWQDGFGHGCEAYPKDGKCMHNAVVHEHEYIKEDAVFRQPHRNCCVCGKV